MIGLGEKYVDTYRGEVIFATVQLNIDIAQLNSVCIQYEYS